MAPLRRRRSRLHIGAQLDSAGCTQAGRPAQDCNYFSSAVIDDVMVFRAGLSEEEIATLVAPGAAGMCVAP